MKLIINESQLGKIILYENIQLADKIYFKTGLLKPEVREDILKITNGDIFTKWVCDFYYVDGPWHFEEFYKLLKRYTIRKNFIPINLNEIETKNVIGYYYFLKHREKIIKLLDEVPSIGLRNIKKDLSNLTMNNIYDFEHKLSYFIGVYSKISNRKPEILEKINNKIFNSKNSLEDMIDFLEDNEFLLSQGELDREKIMEIIEENYDLDLVYDKNNIMVVEVSGPSGMQEIGCISFWCHTYGNNYNSYYDYSTDGYSYVVINLNESPNSSDFMYLVYKPLKKNYNLEDDNYDNYSAGIFYVTNEPVDDPYEVINLLGGYNKAKKIMSF